MDNIKDSAAATKVYAKLVAGREANAEEVIMYEAWQRSGLLESVRSNADMNYMSSTGVGVTFDFMRNASNNPINLSSLSILCIAFLPK